MEVKSSYYFLAMVMSGSQCIFNFITNHVVSYRAHDMTVLTRSSEIKLNYYYVQSDCTARLPGAYHWHFVPRVGITTVTMQWWCKELDHQFSLNFFGGRSGNLAWCDGILGLFIFFKVAYILMCVHYHLPWLYHHLLTEHVLSDALMLPWTVQVYSQYFQVKIRIESRSSEMSKYYS